MVTGRVYGLLLLMKNCPVRGWVITFQQIPTSLHWVLTVVSLMLKRYTAAFIVAMQRGITCNLHCHSLNWLWSVHSQATFANCEFQIACYTASIGRAREGICPLKYPLCPHEWWYSRSSTLRTLQHFTVLEESLVWSMILQPILHRKPVRGDLLLCNRW